MPRAPSFIMITTSEELEDLIDGTAKIPLAKAGGEVFGFNHAHVGGLLANRWKLAPAVQAAVMYHHSPATNPEDWARGFIVKAANTYAHMAATGNGGWIDDLLGEDSLQALGLSAEQHQASSR